MKKYHKIKIVTFALSVVCLTTVAQRGYVGGCSTSGNSSYNTWNPLIAQVKIPSTTLGGFTLPNTTLSTGFKKIIGDFNGDGLDDILMAYPECTNANCSATNGNWLKMFISNGNGDFTNTWTSAMNLLNVYVPLTSSNSTIDITDLTSLEFVVGNFIGDGKDEILVYSKFINSSTSMSVALLSNLNTSPCVQEFKQVFSPPFTTDPKIGFASLNGANFYAANLYGDQHDELFSLESQGSGLPMKWYIQQLDPSGVITGPSGTFNYTNEELYFENFDLSTSYDELFTINKYSNWALLQGFNGSTFYYKWSDMGNGSFFGNGECPLGTYMVNFSPSSQVLFGNLDNCDDDIECMVFNNNDLEHPITLEFSSAQNKFNCNSTLWPTLIGSNNVNATQSSLSVTVDEHYVTPTTCANYLWGTSICLQWTGGNTVSTPRQFYSRVEKDGPLSILMGNFYNNTLINGFVRKTKELLVFKNDRIESVPSNLTGLSWFSTNCSPNGLYGGGCDGNTNIAFNNPLGQTVAYYNKPNNSFIGYGYNGGASYSMYSLTNGIQNLRLGNSNNNSVLNDKPSQFDEIIVSPNPADETIEIIFYSTVNMYETEITIISEKGEVTQVDKTDILEGENKIRINVSHLKTGLYLVKASNKENLFTKKFVKN